MKKIKITVAASLLIFSSLAHSLSTNSDFMTIDGTKEDPQTCRLSFSHHVSGPTHGD